MGWFSGSNPAKISTVKEYNDKSESSTQYLEDLPPKFEDTEPPNRERQPTYKDALQQFKLSDITIERFTTMPCFREAMMSGFQAMGVLSGVTFLIHRNPSRAMNWGVFGFFLGNVIGWEQCRSLRRKSFQTVEKARQRNQEKTRNKGESQKDIGTNKE